MKQEELLKALRLTYPWLYDIQMEVERVKITSGYGEVSFVLKVLHRRVESADVLGSAKLRYPQEEGKI